MDAVTIATLITTIGGIATLILNSLLKDKTSRQDELLKFRSELQTRLEAREAQIDKLRQEYDQLQERYYKRDKECSRIEGATESYRRRLETMEMDLVKCQGLLKDCESKLKGGGS